MGTLPSNVGLNSHLGWERRPAAELINCAVITISINVNYYFERVLVRICYYYTDQCVCFNKLVCADQAGDTLLPPAGANCGARCPPPPPEPDPPTLPWLLFVSSRWRWWILGTISTLIFNWTLTDRNENMLHFHKLTIVKIDKTWLNSLFKLS